MPDEVLDLDVVQRSVGALLSEGEPDAARILLERSIGLAEAEKKPGRVASFLGLLANCYGQLTRFDDAEAAYERALQSADETLQPNHPVRIVLIVTWAEFERSRGALEREERLWQLALPVLADDPRVGRVLLQCQSRLSELQTAGPVERQLRESFERARTEEQAVHHSVAEKSAAYEGLNRPAGELGALYMAMGRHRESIAVLRDRFIMRPEELWRRLTSVGGSQRQPILDEQRCRFNAFLHNLLGETGPEFAQSALETLLWRRGIGLEIHSRANRLARRNPEVHQALHDLRAFRAAYAADVFAAPSEEELRRPGSFEIRIEPIEDNREYQKLEANLLEWLVPEINRFVSRPATCAELASRIPDDAVLIEYWRCTWPDGKGGVAASYVGLVLPANRPDKAVVVPLCDCADLEDLTFDYLSLLCGRSKTADVRAEDPAPIDSAAARALGEKIRARILDPLTSLPFVQKARHLLIVSDGILNRLPLSALPLESGYVMDGWLISYLHTARDLFSGADQSAVPGDSLVIADPAYDWGTPPEERSGFYFPQLEWAAREGQAVAKRLGVELKTATDAKKSLLAACTSPEILHIATHGTMFPARPFVANLGQAAAIVWRDEGELRLEMPGTTVLAPGFGRLAGREIPDQALRSVIALAGVNTWLQGDPLPEAAGNGLLNAEDIAGIDLSSNKLTVLSACETGLGVIGPGEGVLGLRSSFPIAGAETLVTSLWSVDDVATNELMGAFYDNLLIGKMGRAAALQEAQQTVRKNHQDDPYYWAAFVCQGAVGPIRSAL